MPGTTFTDYFHTVAEWARGQPDRVALGYLTEDGSDLTAEQWTYSELIAQSRAVAARLRQDVTQGERALLLYPPGLPFVAAFLGCLAAGVVAVPAPLPDGRDKAQDRLAGIITDSGARVVLTESSIAPIVDGWAQTLATPVPTLATDGLDLAAGGAFASVAAESSAPAFLQYTSGSTSAPKGVVVTHGNLVDNEVEIGLALETDAAISMVSWLPQFHDMGLIGMLLHPLFQGGASRFLSPITFIKRPVTWVRALAKYRATVSVAPNFAFDLVARRCSPDDLAGLDLSTVRSILNGSEPIQWESIARFTTLLQPYGLHEHAVMPVYGLAEATLFVTGTTPSTRAVRTVVDADELAANRLVQVPAGTPQARVLVGSGHRQRLEVLVVDEAGAPVTDGRVGEIWIRGASIAAGYWNMPELSASTFDATPVGGTGGWLRTGDLGASIDGELFVTGRTKDVIIVNGRNLYAHDIEAAARTAAPALARGVGAAFAVGTPERLVLVHELRPEHLGDATFDEVIAAVKAAVFAEFSVPLTELVLVAKGEVARTTSGKIRRTQMRTAHETGAIAPLEPAGQPGDGAVTRARAAIRFPVVDAVEAALGDPRDPSNPIGFDALSALDRVDGFPDAAVRALDALGLAAHYVPAEDGGRLTDYVELSWIIRALARRNVTVAVAHGKTFLGAATAWIGAAPEQRARVSELVRSGLPMSWGLTERAHGSDLLSGDVALDEGVLTGAKWLINNATRGGAVVAIARTAPEGGARGFDLVLLEKAAAVGPDGEPAYCHLPKELTHGIRGADISGIEFLDAPVGTGDVISAPGRGLENVMKALQLTRTLCCSLSLGAAERALHTAVGFAESRELYGRSLIDLPQARRVLSDVLADHLLNEATTVAVLRSVHSLPGELSIHAAAAKFVVPTRTEALLAALRGFVGARSILDPDHADAPPLSRTERDHRIVSLFDGNTVVNLTSLIAQFPVLGRADLPADSARIVGEAEPADLSRLSLLSRTGSTLLRMLPDAVAQLTAAGVPDDVAVLARGLAAGARRALDDAARAERNPADMPDANFAVAERLAVAIAGASAVHVHLAHAGAIDPALASDALWLRLALTRALAALDPAAPFTFPPDAHDAAVAHLRTRNAADRGFSLYAPNGETA